MKLKILLFLFLSLVTNVSYGQKIDKKTTITGIVVDADQNPVKGAAVLIDGVKTNRITNQKGRYKVMISPSAKMIGIFISEDRVFEEEINGRTKVNFILNGYILQQINNQDRDKNEEQVDIGYGTVKRKDLTRSSSAIDGQNKRYSSYGNIYDMISGELPGVQVIGKNIRIQGASSINSGTEPLFVVDGINVGTIDNIQPRLVKSIEVLKGPAASIYGSRGTNGVILITLISGDK